MMAGVPLMEEDRFWALIERSRELVKWSALPNGDSGLEQQAEHLADQLRKLSPEQVAAFDKRAAALSVFAYRWELWDAAYWAHGGCGDDSFMDFRDNLISLGRERFYTVVRDPDSLAEILDRPDVPYLLGEGFGYTAGQVYQELTGRDLQEHFDDYPQAPEEPRGERCDLENPREVKRRLPRLFALLPTMGE